MEKRCPSLPSEICAQFTDGMEHPIKQMGGTTGPGSSIMMLTNLQNSSHIDFNDTFPSFAVWVELKPGTAHDWFVLLLNMSVDSSSGLAVRLYHGDCLFCTNPGDAFQGYEGTGRASRQSFHPDGNDNGRCHCLYGCCHKLQIDRFSLRRNHRMIQPILSLPWDLQAFDMTHIQQSR